MMMFGPRSELRQREAVGELLVAQPMLDVDGEAMHFRHRRIAAADGKQRQHAEKAGERQERAVPGIHSRTHAIAMLIGTMTASTAAAANA